MLLQTKNPNNLLKSVKQIFFEAISFCMYKMMHLQNILQLR